MQVKAVSDSRRPDIGELDAYVQAVAAMPASGGFRV